MEILQDIAARDLLIVADAVSNHNRVVFLVLHDDDVPLFHRRSRLIN